MGKNAIWVAVIVGCLLLLPRAMRGKGEDQKLKQEFHTADRCLACHNQLSTVRGEDVSIGTEWRATIMANSARDPYWQGSVRRETVDHPEVKAEIEDECSVCHMPAARYESKIKGEKGEIFKYLPFVEHPQGAEAAEDGVSCSLCHQMTSKNFGTRESFNGGFVIDPPLEKQNRPEYGPFEVSPGQRLIMESSTGGYRPIQSAHIRDSALCGTCHQLYTTARGEGGKAIGTLPEQMPYLEYLHSDSPRLYTCQSCHMPEVREMTPISSVLGPLRQGLHRHVFVGGNFFMERIFNQYRDELDVAALPQELTAASQLSLDFLKSQAARMEIRNVAVADGRLQAEVFVQNLTGHKLPTAYPSRRAWIHLTVKDRNGRLIFESGALNPDGSVQGNDNDADKERFEPHYREITSADQVQIYEDIMKDSEGRVTTGLLTAIGYVKDNRLLPSGFDKSTAVSDIAVIGNARNDPAFIAGGDTVRYLVALDTAQGPFHIHAELLYQPIGFRWAHNLEPYKQPEPQRFLGYYQSMSNATTTVLTRAETTR